MQIELRGQTIIKMTFRWKIGPVLTKLWMIEVGQLLKRTGINVSVFSSGQRIYFKLKIHRHN